MLGAVEPTGIAVEGGGEFGEAQDFSEGVWHCGIGLRNFVFEAEALEVEPVDFVEDIHAELGGEFGAVVDIVLVRVPEEIAHVPGQRDAPVVGTGGVIVSGLRKAGADGFVVVDAEFGQERAIFEFLFPFLRFGRVDGVIKERGFLYFPNGGFADQQLVDADGRGRCFGRRRITFKEALISGQIDFAGGAEVDPLDSGGGDALIQNFRFAGSRFDFKEPGIAA